jgi:DNA-binding transcriptional regulator YiaG
MKLCPCCESQDVTVTRASIDAAEIGLPSGRLIGVESITCSDCGEESISIPAHGAVIKEYRKQLAHVQRELTVSEFSFLRRSLGLTGRGYAEMLGVSNVTISRIENGDSVPSVQQGAIRAVTILDLVSFEAMRDFVARDGARVEIDVQQVERSHPREVTGGWQEIPQAPAPSNVIRFTARLPREVQLESVCFEAQNDDSFLRRYACP